MQKIQIFFFVLLLATPAFGAETLAQLVDEALRANPSLEAKRAQVEAVAKLAVAAGTWEDPMFSVEYMNVPTDSFRLDRSSMSGLQFKIEQNFPELGWSKTSRELAQLEVSAATYATGEVELQLRQAVEILYWKLALSRALHAVADQHLQRTENLLQAAQSRYETGALGQGALSRIFVLRDRLQDDLEDFEREDIELRSSLARTLGRPVDAQLETPTEFEPLAQMGEFEGWLVTALANRPEFAQLREEIKIEEKSAELARIQARPDVNLWLAYQVRENTAMDDGTDFVSLGVSIPIPLGSRKRAQSQIESRRAGERSARARLAAQSDVLRTELRSVEARWSRAYRKALAYREHLLPAAQLTLQTTLTAFSVDNADFEALYEAQSALIDLQKTYLEAVVETHLQSSAARALTGSDLQLIAKSNNTKVGYRHLTSVSGVESRGSNAVDIVSVPHTSQGEKP